MDKRLYLLDAYALIYRAHYAFFNRPMLNAAGLNTSPIFGFTRALLEILKKEKPTHLAVAFDLGRVTFRTELYPEYKAHRDETPDDIRKATPVIKDILRAMNIPILEVEGYEADDIIGTIAHRAQQHGYTTYMVTPDKDYGQLVTDHIRMYKPKKGDNDIEILGPKEICEQYGIADPTQLIDILALWGDASDNIPGVPGIGEKTACKLIGEWGSVENLLANADKLEDKFKKNFIANKEQMMLSKKLATIVLDVPIEFDEEKLMMVEPDSERLSMLLTELEFTSILKEMGISHWVSELFPTCPKYKQPTTQIHFEKLNDSQRKAVEFNGKHLLVLAGAGTGKTHTIVSRASFLIKNGIRSSRIQILSFTRKSASEIVERVNSMFQNSIDAKQLNGSTFHAWCMNIIKSNPNIFKVSDYTVIDRDDQLSIFKLICGNCPKVIEETRLNSKDLLDIYSFARNTRKNITETIRFKYLNNSNEDSANIEIEKIKSYLISVFKNYESKKRERKYLDYDDILDVVSSGLRNNKDARDYIASQYDHILVDEMQDTNPLQWELLSSFQEKCCLFCVGDDAQSIYAFRGADFTNICKFNERVPNSSVYKLEDNYRSTQEILNISNWLLKQSILNYNKNLNAIRGSGELPVIMNFENEYREAEWIANNILQNFTQKGINFEDHLILVRSSFLGRRIEQFLLEKKIPYRFFGGIGLMASAHIRDIMSALRIVSNIYDEIAWMRFLTIWPNIGEQTASKIISAILELSNIDECIDLLKNKSNKDPNLITTLSSIKDLNNKPSEAIRLALSNMENQLSNIYKQNWDIKRKPDFNILIKLAENHRSIGEFIAEYVLDPILNESYLNNNEEKNAVTISTIHSAKGLESKVCYVSNVSIGSYPSQNSIKEGIDSIEEERRILYVALTRAKDELYITRILNSIHVYNQNELLNKQQIIIQNNISDNDFEKINNSNINQDLYFFNELPPHLAIERITEQTKKEIYNKTYTGKIIEDDSFGIDLS